MFVSLVLIVEVALFTTSPAGVSAIMAKVYGPPETVACFAQREMLPRVVCWRKDGKMDGAWDKLEPFETRVAQKETGI